MLQKHLEITRSPDPKGKQSKSKYQEMNDELLAARLHEASLEAELADFKQKVTELETAVCTVLEHFFHLTLTGLLHHATPSCLS